MTFCTESCSELGAVQLVDGANEYEGRLEVCAQHNSDLYWGTVCNDAGEEADLQGLNGFDINAAKVVCRQLGIQENGELLVQSIVITTDIYILL